LYLVFYFTLFGRYLQEMNMERSDLPLAYFSLVINYSHTFLPLLSTIPKPFCVT